MKRAIDTRPRTRPAQLSIRSRPSASRKASAGAKLWAHLLGMIAGLQKRPRLFAPPMASLGGAEGTRLEFQAFNDSDAGEPPLDGVGLSNDSAGADLGLHYGLAADSDSDVTGDDLVRHSPAVGVPEGLDPVTRFDPSPPQLRRLRPAPRLLNAWFPSEGMQLWDASPVAVAPWNGQDHHEVISWDQLRPITGQADSQEAF